MTVAPERRPLSREAVLERARGIRPWHVVVIGGGCMGLATALDAAARGYRTLLVERGDFAAGTSSRSTKLVHGGVRYLAQLRIEMVYGALRERHRLLNNAPHLVGDLTLLVPAYRWWERLVYGLGLRAYDALAWPLGMGASRMLDRREVLERASTLRGADLRGGVLFRDGQFDDARLGWVLARTASNLGCVTLNYAEATGFVEARGRVKGVEVRDVLGDSRWVARAAVVVNAAGPHADAVCRLDEPTGASRVVLSRGTHIVVSRAFLPGACGVLIPSTDDGRVLFAIPWQGHVVIGTTDVPVAEAPLDDPVPSDREIAYLLDHAGRYLGRTITTGDILSAWAGLRALVGGRPGRPTSTLPRDHSVSVSRRGVVTVLGGKWTTCRRVARDVVDVAADVGGLSPAPSVTAALKLYGYSRRRDILPPWNVYGSDANAVRELESVEPELGQLMHPGLPFRLSQAAWAARCEMAVRLQDVLARRTRALFLNARAAIEAAPAVAAVLARELDWSEDRTAREVSSFTALAERYVPGPGSGSDAGALAEGG